MGITGKELAEKLNISATAVSMALNGKPGVSTEMRKRIIAEAEKAGYDFSRLQLKKKSFGGYLLHHLPRPQRHPKLHAYLFRTDGRDRSRVPP